ncbi:MAG: PKD domain-containing protein [Bacteroidota bacterium]|nr:PKD domain-containing protein [Bacteroidota bacterium]
MIKDYTNQQQFIVKRVKASFYKIVAFVAFFLFPLAVNAAITIVSYSPNPAVAGSPVTVTASNASGDFFVYDFNNNLISSTTSSLTVTFTPPSIGLYRVECRKAGALEDQITISIKPGITFAPSKTSYCTNDADFAIDGITVTPTGGSITTSGTGVSGGNFSASAAGIGTYTITANYTLNGASNSATATFTVKSVPTIYTLNGGSYCYGGTGTSITLTGSEGATTYSLYKNGVFASSKPGTGSSLTWTNNLAGSYYVTASNGSCSTTTNTTSVTENTDLQNFTLSSATTNYCAGSGGLTLSLSGAEAGVSYQLYKNGSPTGAAQSGGPITWANQLYGTYTVIATKTSTGCTKTMSGTVILTENPLPTVYSLSASSTSFCTGLSTTLTLPNSQTGVNYILQKDGLPIGTSSGTTGSAINWAINTAGTYTVVAKNATTGCQSNMGNTFIITENTLPTISINPSSTTICAGSSTMLTASGGASYSWSPAAGLSNAASSNPTASPAATTNYTVTGTDANGCKNTATATVTVIAVPTVNAGADQTICKGDSYILQATGATSYIWDNGIGATNGVTVSPTTTTTYEVTGTTNGCSAKDQITINVKALPSANVQPVAVTICRGATVTLTATGGGTYNWNTTPASTTASVNVSPLNTVTYEVTVTANGCSSKATSTITVNDRPTVDAGPDIFMCHGNSSTITANALGGTTPYSYSWQPNGKISQSITENPSNPPPSTTPITNTYTVTVTDKNGCTATDAMVLTVNPLPTVSMSNLDNSYCKDHGAVTITGLPTGPTGSFSISTTGSITDHFNGTSTFTPNSQVPGTTYSINYSYIDGNNCIATATRNVYIRNEVSPQLSMTGPDPQYCDNDAATKTITAQLNNGTFVPANGHFTGDVSDITTSTDTEGKASLIPKNLGIGNYSATYTYTDIYTTPVNGVCTGSITKPFIVGIPITINVNPSYCVSTGSFVLNVTKPAGTAVGTFKITNTANGNSYSGAEGTATFDPFALGTGTYTIEYSTGSTLISCFTTATKTVTVNALPNATFSLKGVSSADPNPNIELCANGSPEILKAVNSPGTFTSPDPGISGYMYDPAKAGVGPHTIKYTYTDANGCTNSSSLPVKVLPVPSASITMADSIFCHDEGPVTFMGAPKSNGQTSPTYGTWPLPSGWTSTILKDNGDGTATFDPTKVPLGIDTFTIKYIVLQQTGCISSAQKKIEVDFLPTVDFTGLPTDICENASPITLTGSPKPVAGKSTGVFSGNGITDNGNGTASFNPTGLTSMAQPVTYTYTNLLTGCKDVKTYNVTIKQKPVLFSVTGGGTFCENSNTNHIGLGGSVNNVQYQLYLNAAPQNAPLTGTGSALDFGNITDAGLYTIIATNPAPNSCSLPMDGSATVIVNPLPLAASVITGPNKVCPGGTYTYSTTAITYATSYTWSLPAGASITSGAGTNSITVLFGTGSVNGNITVKGHNNCGDGLDASLAVSLLPLPDPAGTITGQANVCQGDNTISYTVPTIANATSYTWTLPPSGVSIVSGSTSNTVVLQFSSSALSGQLTVSGKNACGIGTSSATTINVVPTPTATIDIPTASINCTGTPVVLSSLANPATSTYAWVASNGGHILKDATTATPSVDAAGTFTLTVTEPVNSCRGIALVIVTEDKTAPQNVTITSSIASNAITCTNPTIDLTAATTSTFAVTYKWVASAGGNIVSADNIPIIQANKAGTYTVTITCTATGCTTSKAITITEDKNAPVISINKSPAQLNCKVTTVQLNASAPNSTYKWVPSGTAIGATFTGGDNIANPWVDRAGGYTFTATSNTNGCTATDNLTVTEDKSLPQSVSIDAPATLTCSVTSTQLKGNTSTTAPTYSWTASKGGHISSAATNQTVNIDAAGDYTFTVTHPTSYCTATAAVTVTNDTITPVITFPTAPTAITCSTATSTVTGLVTPATSSFNYSWIGPNGSNISTPAAISSIVDKPGTYSLTATNTTNGCKRTNTVTVPDGRIAPTVTIAPPVVINCNNNPITLKGSTSITNYTASWTGPAGGITGTTSNINVSATLAGTYTLSIKDNDNGCSQSMGVLVSSDLIPPSITINPTPLKLTCSRTSVTLNGISTAGSTYSWTGPAGAVITNATSPAPSVNMVGTYTLTITGANGCKSTGTVTVSDDKTAPSTPVILTPANLTCTKTTTNLEVSPLLTNVDYSWTTTGAGKITNPTNPVATVDAVGDYTVTVTDRTNGCTNQSTVTVSKDNTKPTAVITGTAYQINCTSPSIQLDGSSSTGSNPVWTASNGGHILSDGNTTKPWVDAAGTYTLTMTNATTGCTDMASVIVTPANDLPTISIDAFPPKITCTNSTVTLSGQPTQTGTITYTWLTSPGHITADANTYHPVVDQAGNYTIEVTNTSNGCKNRATIVVEAATTPPDLSVSTPDKFICTTTEIKLSANSTCTNPSYSWTAGTGGSIKTGTENTQYAYALSPGTYTVVLKDQDNQCTSTKTVTVDENKNPPQITLDKNPAKLTCSTTQVNLTGSSLTSGVSYLWTTTGSGNIFNATSPSAKVDAAGTYTLTITDPNNKCTASDNVTVTNDTITPNVSVNQSPAVLTKAVTTVQLSGSSTTADVTFNWAGPGNITDPTSKLPYVDAPGTYTLMVTALNGCTNSESVTVTQNLTTPSAPVTTGATACFGSPAGTLTATGTNVKWYGDASLSIKLHDGNTLTPSSYTAVGIYYFFATQTDAISGNESPATQTVYTVRALPLAPSTNNQPVCQGAANPALTATGAVGSTVKWYNQLTGGTLLGTGAAYAPPSTVSAPGTYFYYATQTDAYGCESSGAETKLIINPLLNLTVGIPDTLTCANNRHVTLNGSADITGSALLWIGPGIESGATTTSPVVTLPGTYTLTAISSGGCPAVAPASVTVIENITPPTVDFPTTPNIITCTSPTATIQSGTSAVNPAWQWSSNDGTFQSDVTASSVIVSSSGNYTLKITDKANGCSASKTINIQAQNTAPDATIATPAKITCKAPLVTLTGSSASTPVTALWTVTDGGAIPTGSENSFTPTVSQAGTYTMTVTNSTTGCKSSATVKVIDDRINTPVISVNATPDVLNCKTTSVKLYGNAANSSLQWSGPAGATIDNPTSSTPTVYTAGNYILTATDLTNGCQSTATVEVKSIASTIVNVSIDAPDTINCKNATVTIKGHSTNTGALYSWTAISGGNIISTSNTSDITVDGQGKYQLTVTDPTSYCTNNATIPVIKLTNAPTISFPTVPTAITCSATTSQLNSTVTTTTGSTATLLWSGPGTISNTAINNPIVNASGNYTLKATDPITGCSSNRVLTVPLNTTPPDVNISTPDTLTCKTLISGITLNGSTSITSYTALWSTSDGSLTSTTNQLYANALKKGTYTLKLINNDNGCSASKNIFVNDNLTPPDIYVDPNPAKITCTNLTTTLFGNSSTNNAQLKWTGTGIVSGDNTSSPVVNAANSYTLTVTGKNGCTSTSTVTTSVDQTVPTAPVIIAPATLNCQVKEVNLSVSNPSSNLSYKWTTTGGIFINNANSATATVSDPGVYTVTATDKANGCSASSIVTVSKDVTLPDFNINSVTQKLSCTNTSLTLSATANVGNNPQWSVSNGGHVSAGGNTLTPVVDGAGTYTLTMTNPTTMCTTTQSINVDADNTLPGLTITPYADKLNCKVTTVTLSGQPTDSNDTYAWTADPGHFAADQISYNPKVDQPGNYILTVKSHITGCTRIASVTVEQDITPPTITINTPDTFFCNTSEVQIQARTNVSNTSFAWTTTSGGLIKPGYNNTANTIVQTDGTYRLTVQNNDNYCTTTSQDIVVAKNKIQPNVVVDQNPDKLTCTINQVILSGSSTTSNVSYLWTPKTVGAKIDNANTIHPTVYATGDYILQVTDNHNSCTNTSSVTVSDNKIAPQVWTNSTPDSLTCTRNNIQLSGSSTTANVAYNWTGPGNISQTNVRDPYVDLKGTYTLTVTDPVNGCTATSDVVVIENRIHPAVPLANSTDNCIQSITSPLTATGTLLKWYNDPALTTSSKVGEGNSFMPSQTTPGTYAYYVTQTDSHNGCESNATSVNFIIKPKSPSPTVPAPVEICFGQTTPTLSVQGTNVKWYDAPNGNLLGTGNSLSTGKTAVGTYLFYATQTDGSGCESNPVAVQLTIHSIPSAPVLEKTDVSICSAEAIPSLTASGSSIKWYADNLLLAPISTGNSYTPNISLNGTYSYYATQTSVYGCESATAKADIHINPTPLLFDVTGGGSACEGTGGVSVGLSGSSTGVTYQLLLNGNFSTAITKAGTGTALDFGKQLNEGVYSVLATAANTCSKNMNGGVSVLINPLPHTAGSILGDGIVCQGSTVSFVADSIPYATYYEWSLPTGANIVTGGNTRKISIFFGTNATSGTLSVKGKNDCGYGGLSSAKSIVVNPLPGDAIGSISGPTQICQGEKYALYQFPSITNATSYEWTIPAGAKIVSGNGTNQIAVDFTLNDVGGSFTVRGVNSCGKGSISASFNVILKNKPYAYAGYDQITCSSTGKLAATAPEAGATGMWTTIIGPAAVTNINDPASKVMGLMMGENKLIWTVTKNGCSAADTVILKNNTVLVDAGDDQTLCSKTAQLAARSPLTGGVWNLVKGSAVFYNGDYDNPQAKVSGLSQGENKLVWTVSNGCISNDTVVLVCNKPTTPDAGALITSLTDVAQLAAAIPETGTIGTWTVLSGAGNFEDKHLATSKVSNLNPGVNLLIWTVTRNGCSLSDTVSVEYQYPEIAEAGPDQAICKDNTTLAGNEPVTGIGQWSIVKGAATFTDASLYNTKVSGLNYGRNVLKWSIRKGGSSVVSDTVVIINNSVTIANAGLAQTICTDTTTISAGPALFGSGKWTVVSGSGTFDNELKNTTLIRNLASGVNTLKWAITKENCYSESLVTITNNTPTTANAGPDIKSCADSVVLIPNTPTIGTGSWSVISGSAIIKGNTMTKLATDNNVLRWTITKGNCTSTDDVTIINHKPSKADAGVDKSICADSIFLGANRPLVGTGKWTLQSGSAIISDTTYSQPAVRNLALGSNIFRWTITYHECSNYDEVIINSGFIKADAGKDRTICDDKIELNANSAWPGKGTWSVVGNKSSATFVNQNSPNSQVINLEKGNNTLRWTIINGSCTSSADVIITNNLPSTAYAGADVELCKNNTILEANQPVVGTGKWEILSGSGIVKDTSLYNSKIDSLALGVNILRWSVTNKGCISSDEVKITNNQPINVSAGKDQIICKDSTYLYANKPSIGTGQWSILTGAAHFANSKQFDTYVSTLGRGTNIFKWTVTSGQCSVSDTVKIVNNTPGIAMAGPDQTLCQDSVQLSGNNPTDGTGEWILIGGSASIKDKNNFATKVTNLGFGINRFRWQVTKENCALSDDVIITNNLPSKPYAGTNQSVCADSTVLYANIPEVGKGSWSVIAGNGAIANPDSNQTKINRLVFGTNAFRWTTSNQNCKLYSDVVVIDNLAEINAGVDQIVFTSTANLIGNNPSKGTGKWYLAAGNGTIQNPGNFSTVANGLGAGKNTFKWTIENNGCVASDLVNIMYYVMPIPDFIPSITQGCPPLTVSFVNKSIGGAPYHWDLGDSHYSDETNIIHTYTKAGTYKVKMTATSATGGTVEKDTIITVHALPKAAFDLAPIEVFAPDQKMQTHNFSEYSTSWLWNFGDGNTSKEFTPTHAYADSGFYTVSLIAWTEHQCSDTLTINNAVHVIEKSKFKFPSAFTPNISGSSDGRYNPRDYSNDVFYPTIINGGIKEYHLEIFNRWGLKLFRSDDISIGWDGYFKGKLMTEGVYIYQATGIYNNGKRFSVTGDVLLIRK